MKTVQPERSADVDFFPGLPARWGLATLINLAPGPHGRSPGSLSWAGLFNTYYWLDPARRLIATIMTQILPFAEPRAVALYGAFERHLYAALDG
jgi:CubicO group peptidase (beta-lactamase class C family)